MNYQNFDLEIISSQGNHQLYARVLESPQGDSPFIGITWPFEAEEENEFLGEIYGGLRQRRIRPNKMAAIQDFGGRLFDAVFMGDIEHLFRSSLDAAARNGKGLRLRLRLRLPDDSALHSRPWEFLFDTESREFLAVKENTPLVRYLPVAHPIPPISVEGPLRILVALAAPSDHPRLDVSREWEILASALETPMATGKVELRKVPGRCTFDNLRDSLRHYGAHIFHFIGHGIPGALVLEQESGRGLEMEASQLRAAFPAGMLPRLIVLNSCSGAVGEDMPFSGMAQGFLRQGVPAVVAMQASITDDAALIFTRYFYRDLIGTGAVDTSLTEARLRMQGNGHPIEWGTPVLYMRALSGQLFQPGSSADEAQPALAPVTGRPWGPPPDPVPPEPAPTVVVPPGPVQPVGGGRVNTNGADGGARPVDGRTAPTSASISTSTPTPAPPPEPPPEPPPVVSPFSEPVLAPVPGPTVAGPPAPLDILLGPSLPFGIGSSGEGKRPSWLLPAAGLLALSLAIAGAYLSLRGKPGASSTAPPAVPTESEKATTIVEQTKPREPAAPARDKSVEIADAKPSTPGTRKPSTQEKRKPAALGIDCSNPEIAERRAECLLRK